MADDIASLESLVLRLEEIFVRERMFREDFHNLIKREVLSEIDNMMRRYFLRSPVAYSDQERVLVHTNDGHRLLLDMRETFMAFHIIEHGEWETDLRNLMRRLLPVGGTFVDVGANIGVHSLFAARLVGDEGRVVALEPHPRTRSMLCDNIEINGLHERIVVRDVAAYSEAGLTLPFQYFPQHPAMSGFSVSGRRVDDFAGTPQTIDVRTTTLDELSSTLGTDPDLVKIDVEGFELTVLEGARELLSRSHDTAFVIEYDPEVVVSVMGEDAPEKTWRLLCEFDLRAYRVGPSIEDRPMNHREFADVRGKEDVLLVRAGSRPLARTFDVV